MVSRKTKQNKKKKKRFCCAFTSNRVHQTKKKLFLCGKIEQAYPLQMSTLPPAIPISMSPFADKPELWLTSHIRRLSLEEPATKIQAVVKGFLVRHRQEQQRNADALLGDVLRRLTQPKDVSVVGLMRSLGLDTWADGLPTAEECIMNPEAANRRREALWHAGISLRLTGQGSSVQDLEWADYHERSKALYAHPPPPPPDSASPHVDTPVPDTLWLRLMKIMWG